MKKMKKILAFVMAMAMVLGMSVTAFASSTTTPTTTPGGVEGEAPKPADKATITVKDIEAGATVKAYQIVKAKYKDDTEGFLRYEAVEAYASDMENYLKPTASEVGQIAQKLPVEGGVSVNPTAPGSTTYSAEVEAGYWVVVVTQSESKSVYNPMLLGVYYSVSGSDNTMTEGEISAKDKWNLNGAEAYSKKTEATIEKTIVTEGTASSKGDAAGANSTVKYQIVSTIPTYSEEYTEVTYKITDTLPAALTISETSVKITADNTIVWENGDATPNNIVTINEKTATVVNTPITAENQSMVIEFGSDWILANGGKSITVEYSAVVKNDFASNDVNFIQHNNKAELEFTNNPGTDAEPKKKESITHHYTFGLDADLYGTNTSEWNKTTEEILKTGEKHTETINGTDTETVRLSGARFKISNTDGFEKEATSDEYGRLAFTGLDAGTYTLEEVEAPEGYTLNTEKLTVVITPNIDNDGLLQDYTVAITDGSGTTKTSTYTATYGTDGVITDITAGTKSSITSDTLSTEVSDTMEFKNTTLTTLPSTGGIGTTIFTIGGCAIMIIAAGLFFASRRKSTK